MLAISKVSFRHPSVRRNKIASLRMLSLRDIIENRFLTVLALALNLADECVSLSSPLSWVSCDNSTIIMFHTLSIINQFQLKCPIGELFSLHQHASFFQSSTCFPLFNWRLLFDLWFPVKTDGNLQLVSCS